MNTSTIQAKITTDSYQFDETGEVVTRQVFKRIKKSAGDKK